ncbi:hypothetical protein [Microcoleus sp. FACHB-672]
MSAWKEAVCLDPNFAEAYLNLRNALLLSGSHFILGKQQGLNSNR